MPTRTLFTLARLSLQFGQIDFTEYDERVEVARWIADEDVSAADPRKPPVPERESCAGIDEPAQVRGTGKIDEPEWMELLVLGKWLFTKSDPDAYPSTPHGHMHYANREWPKLNPYTGRVFKEKHQEDPALRLGKHEMRRLWRNHAFRDFCRSYILFYVEAHPYYRFSVRDPLRFPTW